MPAIEKHLLINNVDGANQISISKWRKQKHQENNLETVNNDKSIKHDPVMPYIVTFFCVLIVISIIFALVIYIRNRRTATQKHLMIDYKSSAFKFISLNDPGSSVNEEFSDKSEKVESENCWFSLGTLKQALNEFSLTKQNAGNSQRISKEDKKNINSLLIKEVQPVISKEESFYLGGSNTLAFSPQSVGSVSGFRAKNKGLLESRRGSRTSLTLSLSPSIDSMSSTRSPSPLRTDVEHDRYILENNSLYLTIDELRKRVYDKSETLFQEFWAIPMNHTTRGELSVFGMANKNRYKSILPNEQTRVILPQINDNYLSTYINANYIRDYKGSGNKFIATQGPMPQTVIDFWRLVWHVQASAIVMLTKLTENNKRKCEYYLPNDVVHGQMFGTIFVSIESSMVMEGYTVRKLSLKKGDIHLSCTHLWFTSWPDHGSPTPQTTHDLLSLVESLQQIANPREVNPRIDRPVIVHCSAGLGRTGCFIALFNGCQQLLNESGVDVLGIVSRLRLDRGGMINNNEQYEFLHRALLQFSERHSLLQPGPSLSVESVGDENNEP